MSTQGARLSAIMADHDRGAEYAFVQCIGDQFTCAAEARIENSAALSDQEIRTRLAEAGWSVLPTLCPGHQLPDGSRPSSSADDHHQPHSVE